MTGLVVGTFEAENQAARAVRKLLNSCVPSEHVRTLSVRPRRRGTTLRRSRGQAQQRPQRGGITVAVRTRGHVAEILALRVLREHGARDVGHALEPLSPPASNFPTGSAAQFALPL